MIFVRRESEHNRGTGCEKTARPGLCGGPPVTGVPTARVFCPVGKHACSFCGVGMFFFIIKLYANAFNMSKQIGVADVLKNRQVKLIRQR